MRPPAVRESHPAAYPPAALAEGREGHVELGVVVSETGVVDTAEVLVSAGADFDAAALEAIRAWRFTPAEVDGRPAMARIRVPFDFLLPEPEPEPAADAQPEGAPPGSDPDVPVSGDASDAGEPDTDVTATEGEGGPGAAPGAGVGEDRVSAATDAAADELADDEDVIDVTVRGQRDLRTEERSVSDFQLRRDQLRAAPRSEGTEVLRAAPGLYIGRSEGPAVAHNYMLRGFDAEHGQDIAFRVGGLPINLPSHIHGQGYADLGFLIADVVSGMNVSAGVSDPRQGDFAVAGSIDISLGVGEDERGVRVASSYGSFRTSRQLLLFAPRGLSDQSFGALQYTRTDGFGQNRAGQAASAILQHGTEVGDFTLRAIGVLHTARSDLAGVLRRDDIDAGRVCFTCVYDQPTARAQNALSSRVMVGLFADYRGERGDSGQLGVWLGYDSFRIQENFTGYIQSSRTLARVAGRGDLIEQQNRTRSVGLVGRYRTAPMRPTTWAHGTLELGIEGRMDGITQQQSLLDAAVRNQTWDQRVDASVRGVDVGFWADLDWHLTQYLDVRAGVRGAVLSYDIEDRLGNFVPVVRPDDAFIMGFRRSALGTAFGPRVSARVTPLPWLEVLAAYGEGYRSPQARLLEDGEPAPFSKVRSGDLGVRITRDDTLELTLGAYYTRLSDDVAFDAAEGRLERIGATQRVGGVLNAVVRPLDWLVGSLSVTVVGATLRSPPPPSAEEPFPPYERGQRLPFVPPVVIRAELGASHVLRASLGGHPLTGRAGVGYSYLSARPLPFDQAAAPVSLLDIGLSLQWRALDLGFQLNNAINTRYAAVEYNFASDWSPDDGFRSRTPARHISAGAPLSLMVTLGVTL
ncbi:MAG: TonB family protein [Sandaracinaceae bacterium]|nr:TonB family protein [Sandaracinaceae bacterium]